MHLDPRHKDRADAPFGHEAVRELDVLITPRTIKALVESSDATRGV